MYISVHKRLDEQPGSKWKPQLSSTEFQTLLSNLTAIKIRGTFGENGEYLISVLCNVSVSCMYCCKQVHKQGFTYVFQSGSHESTWRFGLHVV